MLEKCANPACSATLRRLCDGRLFVIEAEDDYQSSPRVRAHQRQYFWLCTSCCHSMTVIAKKGKRAQVVPLPESAASAGTGS
jgi:hypothetical protein